MSMDKLKKCRICLVENVRMYVVASKKLQEIYEKLTDVLFVTEDSRPMVACFFCYSKLKQCYQLQRKCLAAEELFTQMLNENYETKPLIKQDPLEFFSGLNITPTVHLSIVDVCQTESIAIKEELPDVCERLDDIIEPKEEHQWDELEPEKFNDSCLDVADVPPYHSETDLEDDVPLMEIKIEVEEEQNIFKNKLRARKTKRATVAKKQKLNTRRTKVDAMTADRTKKEMLDSKVIRIIQKRTSKSGTYFKEPYECDQRSFNPVKKMKHRIRAQIGEKPYKCDVCQRIFSQFSNLKRHILIHTGEKPYKCDVCQRSFSEKCDLTKHIRTHTGEKPFKCDICQCSFRQSGHLTNHIRQHTGEKPYKCDVCQRSFSLKNTLTKHIRIHTGEKPFKCDVCQRSFSEKGALKSHVYTHTGEKPYKCDVCQSNFNQKGYLAKHIRIHTGEKPLKRM